VADGEKGKNRPSRKGNAVKGGTKRGGAGIFNIGITDERGLGKLIIQVMGSSFRGRKGVHWTDP